jgi:hypothetical protein
LSGRKLPRLVAAAHQAGMLVGFQERIHAATEAMLSAVLSRAEVAAATGPDSTERFSTELAGPTDHFDSL